MNSTYLDSHPEVERGVSAISKIESTIDVLRARTATHHYGLESGLQIQNRLSDGVTRGPLIAGYFAFYRETSAALSPHLANISDLAFSSRIHSRQIPGPADLSRHGTLLVNPVFPPIGTKAEALGAFYVLEGSTLGGRTILKALRSQGVPTDDLHFLDPYGKQAGAHWRAFLGILERETGRDQSTVNECVSGAVKAFSFAAMCLRPERTN